ncbi:MAG: hypothetical protein H6606_07965 [Flavobacteriales bacterium]|nr:hypothetical protein [Flavobacteriales bacterium]
MITRKTTLTMIILALFFFTACNEDEQTEPKKAVTLDEFVGSYTLNNTSYRVPLDTAGNEISTEKISLENEELNLSKGNGDTLIFESPSLGRVKGKGEVNDQTIRVNFHEQDYVGKDVDPTGPNTIKTIEPINLNKDDLGKKEITGDAWVDRPMGTKSRYRIASLIK